MIILLIFFLFNYRDTAENIGKEFCRDMDYKMVGVGYGVMDEVNRYQLMFETKQKFNKDAARILMVSSMDDLLSRINRTKKLRPYLDHYPYTEKGVKLTFLYDEGSVSAINGKVYFTHPDKHEEVESYEEAKGIVSKRLPSPSA